METPTRDARLLGTLGEPGHKTRSKKCRLKYSTWQNNFQTEITLRCKYSIFKIRSLASNWLNNFQTGSTFHRKTGDFKLDRMHQINSYLHGL